MKNDKTGKVNLKSIQNYIQQIADAFAAVIDYEVAIVDERLEVLAGTGNYKERIGSVYRSGSINYQLRRTQKSVLVHDPQKSTLCRNCVLKETCNVLAGLLYPIKFKNQFFGSVSLYAFNESQKENLLRDFTKLEIFLKHLVELLSGKINEMSLYERAKKTAEQFNILINSIREGIVAVDYQGKITHANHSATNMLKVPLNHLSGQMIEDVFAGISLNSLLKMNKPYMEQDIFYKSGQKTLHFMSTVTEVKYGEVINGFVFSVRSLGEIRKMAGRIMRDDRKYTFDGILGQSAAIATIKKNMCTVAKMDSTILITGESGTGKELFAHAIHNESLRKKGPFIAVNCGAIPENLLESELFGYAEGAFTGALRSGKPGKFELANGGTVFLDEIGDMPLHLQVKLLRVLQEYTIERVGAVKPVNIDVRIIAATNRNLDEMIKTKQFRSDLYYRLSVIPFHIPPLRERVDDLQLLIHYFSQKYSLILGKDIKGYAKDALARMLEYSWPGNVRELENAVEYSANICPDSLIGLNYLPDRIKHSASLSSPQPTEGVQSIADLEKKAIEEALKMYGTNNRAKEKIARYLGMSRSTLYRKIKELGIHLDN